MASPVMLALVLLCTMAARCNARELMGRRVHPEYFEIRRSNATYANTGEPTSDQYMYNFGGPTMTNKITVYYILYGTFSTTSKTILSNYTKGLNASAWWGINRPYSVGDIVFGGTKTYSASKTNLKQSDVEYQVRKAITSGTIGPVGGSTDAIYVLLTDKTVDQRETTNVGFCTHYCGWHSYMSFNGKNIKYSWVGSTVRCPSACSILRTGQAPNGNFEMDSMVSIIAHELAETATDPEMNGWMDVYGAENADKCSWDYGVTNVGTPKNANGLWNVQFGTNKFLIQRNWAIVPAQGCSLGA